jgi:hypothetical protein
MLAWRCREIISACCSCIMVSALGDLGQQGRPTSVWLTNAAPSLHSVVQWSPKRLGHMAEAPQTTTVWCDTV